MAVYPFYVESNSSTRRTTSGVGCRAKNGYMTTSIYQRDNGAITTPYKVYQYSHYETRDDGKEHLVLTTEIIYQGEVIHSHSTDY